MKLTEIPVSEVLASDVGKRAVVARDGNTFDGILTDLYVTRSEYDFKETPRITARITLKTLTPAARQSMSDKVQSELKLSGLPLDYRIQIERTPAAPTPEEES